MKRFIALVIVLLCACYEMTELEAHLPIDDVAEVVDAGPTIIVVTVTEYVDAGRPNVVYEYEPKRVDVETCDGDCTDTYDQMTVNQTLLLPRSVYIDTNMTSSDQRTFLDAIVAWNAELSAPVFVPVPSDSPPLRESCDVFATTVDMYEGDRVIGWASWNACSAYASMLSGASRGVAIHELGHTLNLPHEDDVSSYLNAYVAPNQTFSERTLCLVEKAMCESGQYHIRGGQ